MKFTRMTIENWRTYRGRQELKFSTDPSKPITLIFCENGGGKTALLNAFTWALYEKVTPGFQNIKDLINHWSLSKDPSSIASIELEIVENDDVYVITRKVDKSGQEAGTSKLTVTKNGGVAYSKDIEKLLPEQLKDLFFIQGEGAASRNIASSDNTDWIQITNVDAINSLLGLDTYNRLIECFKGARDQIKPPRSHKQDTVNKYWDEVEELTRNIEDRRNQIRELNALISNNEKQIAEQQQIVNSFGEAANPEYKERLSEFEEQEQQCKAWIQDANAIYKDYSYYLSHHFAQNHIDISKEKLDLAKQFELMPSKIDTSSLEQSLTEKKCYLCQQDLPPESLIRIGEMLDFTTSQSDGITGNILRTGLEKFGEAGETRLNAIKSNLSRIYGYMGMPFDANCSVQKIPQFIQSLLGRLEDYGDQLKQEKDKFLANNANGADAIKAVKWLNQLQRSDFDWKQTRTEHEQRVNDLEVAYSDAYKRYENAAKGNKSHQVGIEATKSLNNILDYLKNCKDLFSKYARQDLAREISEAYRLLSQMKAGRTLELNDNYTVQAREGGILTTMGGAENNISQLAFIGAIARVAPFYKRLSKEPGLRYQLGNVTYDEGNAIPVVFDAITSAFGQHYASTVIKGVPKLLPQIILPTKKEFVSEWESISEQIGGTYCVTLNLTHNDNEGAVQSINWAGKDHEYVRIDPSEEGETYARVKELV